MQPLHRLTEQLNIGQRNIDESILVIQNIATHFKATQRLEQLLNDALPPRSKEFGAALTLLTESIAYLEAHREFKSSKSTLEKANKVLKQSFLVMSQEFQDLIASMPRGVDDATISTIVQDVGEANMLVKHFVQHDYKPVHEIYCTSRLEIYEEEKTVKEETYANRLDLLLEILQVRFCALYQELYLRFNRVNEKWQNRFLEIAFMHFETSVE